MAPNTCPTRFRTVSVIVTLLCFASSAVGQTTAPKLTEAEKFIALKDTTIQAVNTISGYRATEVYEEADKLVKQCANLLKKVQAAENSDVIIGDIESSVTGMAASYRRLAALEVDVTQAFNKQVAVLQATQQTIAGLAANADTETVTYQKAIAEHERVVQWGVDAVEKRKREITIGGLKSKINSVRARKVIWDRFSSYQEQLGKTLTTSRDNISLLFHVLKTSAEVYEEAGKTIQIRKIAFDALLGLPPIESIVVDVMNTWLAIDDIVTKVSEADFTFDAKQGKPGI